MKLESKKLGIFNKKEIIQYRLSNNNNVEILILNIGATIQSIYLPLKSGKRNIVLGFENYLDYISDEYLNDCPNFGAAIGRVAGRIEKGELYLNDTKYQLTCNHGKHQLHGGNIGFNQRIWERDESNKDCLSLKYISPDGEENFPNELTSYANFNLTEDNRLEIEYIGISENDTAINITNHSYFNLSNDKTILDHTLQMNINSYLEMNEELIHTGKKAKLPKRLDFREEKSIIKDMGEHGYDHTYCTGEENMQMKKIARLSSPNKDISLEISTNQSHVQVYAGEFVNTKEYGNYAGIAFEPQAQPYLKPLDDYTNIVYNNNKQFNNNIVLDFVFIE